MNRVLKRSRQACKVNEEEFATIQSIYPTAAPVESRSLAIWGKEGMKVPETKTDHYFSIRRLSMRYFIYTYAGLDQ